LKFFGNFGGKLSKFEKFEKMKIECRFSHHMHQASHQPPRNLLRDWQSAIQCEDAVEITPIAKRAAAAITAASAAATSAESTAARLPAASAAARASEGEPASRCM
jgi:hypothetical protein